jgi:hypothetical protein
VFKSLQRFDCMPSLAAMRTTLTVTGRDRPCERFQLFPGQSTTVMCQRNLDNTARPPDTKERHDVCRAVLEGPTFLCVTLLPVVVTKSEMRAPNRLRQN